MMTSFCLNTKGMMTLEGHTSYIFSVAFSVKLPTILATGSDDTTVKLWNVDTGECTHVSFSYYSN